jgi:hypothetical protein
MEIEARLEKGEQRFSRFENQFGNMENQLLRLNAMILMLLKHENIDLEGVSREINLLLGQRGNLKDLSSLLDKK